MSAIVPTTKVKVHPHGLKKNPVVLDRALFPGYVFCQYEHQSQRADVRNYIPFVYNWLRFGQTEATVSGDEMARVRFVLEQGVDLFPQLKLTPGDRVRVKAGCLAGLPGEFIREHREGFVVINMPWFGRSVKTPIELDLLELA